MVNCVCEETFCFKMFFKNIVNSTVISVDHIGVVPWCIIWWFIWFFVRTVYKRCFQSLLKKISISDDHSQQLIGLYWSIAFTSITVPFTMHNLNLNYSDVTDRFYYVLENHISRWFSVDANCPVQTKLSYVILAGFYLNNISEASFQFGLYSKEFIVNELLGLFFIATFPLRCVQYGLAVTTIINGVDFFLSLSKLFSCFCDIAQTKSLRVLVYIFFLFHSILWFFSYFYILPTYFMLVSLNEMRQAKDVRQISMYILLNSSLIGHYLIVLFTSSVSVMTFNYVKSLKISIFKSEDINEVHSSLTNEEYAMQRQRKKENLLMLYHTVKCVIRIKRKLAKMRKEKNLEPQINCDVSIHENTESSYDVEDHSEHESAVENIVLLSTDNDDEATENNYTEEIQYSDGDCNVENDDCFDNYRDLSNEDLAVELTN